MQYSIVLTKDGSATIFNKTLNEHYHSMNGAIQESLHVFINAGLKYKSHNRSHLSVLEIGLGTGLNALLTCCEAENNKLNIEYTAIEKYPLNNEILNQLDYCKDIKNDKCHSYFNQIHDIKYEESHLIHTGFLFIKKNIAAEFYHVNETFDIIYFDAFSPNKQPELWSASIFLNMFDALKPNGVLVTYCAKGDVKRNLKSAGFTIESLVGPIGKREMTRAHKIIKYV